MDNEKIPKSFFLKQISILLKISLYIKIKKKFTKSPHPSKESGLIRVYFAKISQA
jgi:hypothetical protein